MGGGGSSSSGDKEVDAKKSSSQTQNKQENKSKDCVSEGSTVHVTKEGCFYSLANLNGGEKQLYVCKNGRVNLGGISGGTVKLGETTFTCK